MQPLELGRSIGAALALPLICARLVLQQKAETWRNRK